ncbi:hypothetical protein RCO48_35425 [Peribacillus frigoritolerans]|nr:hypothetical protein [Peribacillus frigoritolerans]
MPNAIKSGIILGAGIGAVVSIFEVGGKFDLFPYTISICIGFAFLSAFFRKVLEN